MARRIKDAFKNGKAFIAFITAGDPDLAATEEYILEMERAGADLIEIGIPFSDPIAEGVVIQEADLRALRSGTGECGISGIIIPDLPYEEKGECEEIAAAHGVDVISMIAPTSEARIRAIASEARGFLYVVSSMGVTGVRSEIKTDLGSIMSSIREAADIPAAVGFGINTPQQAAEIAAICDGVIVGSAIVRIVAQYGREAGPHIYEYVRKMKDAIR